MASDPTEGAAVHQDEPRDAEAPEANVGQTDACTRPSGTADDDGEEQGQVEGVEDDSFVGDKHDTEEKEAKEAKKEPIVSTALIDAAGRDNDVEKVKELLDSGADIEEQASDGARALHIACQDGSFEVVKLLLEKGAEVNSIFEPTKLTPLHFAAHRGHAAIIHLLLENGADHSALQHQDCTPLLLACYKRHREAVKILLEHGADASVEDEDGWVPLECVVRTDAPDFELIKLLVTHGALQRKSGLILRIVCSVKAGVNLDVVKLLLDNDAKMEEPYDNGMRVLHHACQNGLLDVVTLLLEKGADVNSLVDSSKSSILTPMHFAANQGHADVVQLLLKNGADHSIGQHEGSTPLVFACANSRLEAVRVLLEHGADPTVTDESGGSPLAYIVRDEGENIELIKLLIKYGAMKGNPGRILRMACLAKEDNADIVELLLDNGANNEERDGNMWRPLHIACSQGHKEVVKLLLARGAQQAVKSSEKHSPLTIALNNGHIDVVNLLIRPHPKASKLDRPKLGETVNL